MLSLKVKTAAKVFALTRVGFLSKAARKIVEFAWLSGYRTAVRDIHKHVKRPFNMDVKAYDDSPFRIKSGEEILKDIEFAKRNNLLNR